MKKLLIPLLTLPLIVACEYTTQAHVSEKIKKVCIDEVTYLVLNSDYLNGLTVQLDKDSKIVPCKVGKNESGYSIYLVGEK